MKRIVMKYLNLLYATGLLFLAAACEKEIPKFSETDCQLNFYFGDDLKTESVRESMKKGSHSFKLHSAEGQMRDTVWLEVATMGKLSAQNRPVALEQIELTDTLNAVPGKHYVPFNDASLADLYRIPANEARVKLPIVVLRDPSLEEGDVVLRITFRDNGYFQSGYPEFSTYTLTISDNLTKPDFWDKLCPSFGSSTGLDYIFGKYSPEKHALMIKWTQKPWDDEYIESLCYELMPGWDMWLAKEPAYIDYLASWFAEQLEEENAERVANGEEPWEVDFTPLDDPWGY